MSIEEKLGAAESNAEAKTVRGEAAVEEVAAATACRRDIGKVEFDDARFAGDELRG